MNIRTATDLCYNRLSILYESAELTGLVRLLLSEILGLSYTEMLLIDKDRVLTLAEHEHLVTALQRLETHEPIQYVLGKAYFHDYDFEVASGVLIPRPETELLCDEIIRKEHRQTGLRILDIGCGSGCIAITLANKLHKAEVWGLEMSSEALIIGQRNAGRLVANQNIHLLQGDITQSQPSRQLLGLQFDLIVSNPPYIRPEESQHMRPNVLQYEPHQALFAPPKDPLYFYRHIARFSQKHLTARGRIYLEVNEALAQEVAQLMQDELKLTAEVQRDWREKERFVYVNCINS